MRGDFLVAIPLKKMSLPPPGNHELPPIAQRGAGPQESRPPHDGRLTVQSCVGLVLFVTAAESARVQQLSHAHKTVP